MFSVINRFANSSNVIMNLADKMLEKIAPSTTASAIRCRRVGGCGACGSGSCGANYITCGSRLCCSNGWCGPTTTSCSYCGGGSGNI